MQKTFVKYSIFVLCLLMYINRGIFITPYEHENQGNKEVNTLIEWAIQLITGESNDIDEDGDLPSDCNSVKTVNVNFFAQYLELAGLFSNNIDKIAFPNKENIPQKNFYTQIDHPPQR